MKKPDLRLAIAINKRVRSADEWFDEPDELERIESALLSIEGLVDPIEAAGILAFRVTRAQGFAEGNNKNGPTARKVDPGQQRSRQPSDHRPRRPNAR